MEKYKLRYGSIVPGDIIAISGFQIHLGVFTGTHNRENEVLRYYSPPSYLFDLNGNYSNAFATSHRKNIISDLYDTIRKHPFKGNNYIYGSSVDNRVVKFDLYSFDSCDLKDFLIAAEEIIKDEY